MHFEQIQPIISCVGFFVTIFNFFRLLLNKNKCIPTYTFMTKTFIPTECQNVNNLKITYKNDEIERLTITTFVFWNSGNKELLKKHYGRSTPYLSSQNCKILDYSILDIDNDNFINLTDEFYDNKIFLNFDTISRNQGFVIKVLHTGNTNNDITCNFSFNNIKCKRKMLFNKKRTDIFKKLSFTSTMFLLSLLTLILIIYGFLVNTALKTMFFMICLFLLLFFVIVLDIKESYVPYLGVPKRFQKYIAEIDY